MRCTGALSVVLGVCRKQRIVVLCNHYTNYTKTKKYLTKLRISNNVQYKEILLEVSNNTTNRKGYFSTMKY